jgi:hypothetical protein
MRLSVVVGDATVYLDGVPMMGLDLSFVPADVHALQWREDKGEIEYVAGDTKPANEHISVLPSWAEQAIQKWNEAKQAKDAEEAHFAAVRAAILEARA